MITYDSRKLESLYPFNSNPNKAELLGNQHDLNSAPSFPARVELARLSSEVPFVPSCWPAVNWAAFGAVSIAGPEAWLADQKLLFVGFGNGAGFTFSVWMWVP